MSSIEASEAPRSHRLEAAEYDSIRDVAEEEWNLFLSLDDLQARWRFVDACERSSPHRVSFRHVVIRDCGRPVCIASLCVMDVPLELLASVRIRNWLSRLRRVQHSLLRPTFVLCGLPVSFGESSLRFAPGVDHEECLKLVAESMETFALETRATVMCFKEFTDNQRQHVNTLEPLGYFAAPSLPGCSLNVDWTTFEDYLDALRSNYRRQIEKDMARSESLGITCRIVSEPHTAVPTAYSLYEQIIERAEHRLERLREDFIRELAFFPDSTWLLLEHHGNAVASAIVIHGPTNSTFLLAGLDYEAEARWRVYPRLVTEVIRHTVLHHSSRADEYVSGSPPSTRRLELGQTSYTLKTRLGGHTSPRWVFLKHRRPLVSRALSWASPRLFPRTRVIQRRVFRDTK